MLPLGPHFSNIILFEAIDPAQALSPKAEEKKHLVIGSTSELGFSDSVGFCDAFSVTHHDARKALEQLNALLMKTSCSCRGPERCTIILGHSFGIFHGLFQFLYL